MWVFIILALVGLLVSLAANVSTYLGVDPQQAFPHVWLLHFGMFVVFIPAAVLHNTVRGDRGEGRRRRGSFTNMPRWMRVCMGVLFAYALVNAFTTWPRLEGSPQVDRSTGGFVLNERGKVVRRLSAAEYHHHRALEVRGMSGHWMMLYGLSAATIWSATRHLPPSAVPPPPVLRPRPAPGNAWRKKKAAGRRLQVGGVRRPAVLITK